MATQNSRLMSRLKEEAWLEAIDEMACLLDADEERKDRVDWAWELVHELQSTRLPHMAIRNIGWLVAAAYRVGRKDEEEGSYSPGGLR